MPLLEQKLKTEQIPTIKAATRGRGQGTRGLAVRIAVVSPKSGFARRRSPGLKSIRPTTYNTLQHGELTSRGCYFS